MSSRTIRIGLVGCGVVGTGVLNLLRTNAATIQKRLGAALAVEQIAVKNLKRKRSDLVPREILTDDPLAVARNPKVDIVVEVMGGIEPAEQVVREALEQGKQVVTANKALLAEKGDAIFDLAKQKGLDVSFEAAVAGGIPIIRTLEESLASDEIVSVQGIINGTSNYILTEMAERGLDFDVALKSAQAAGYAEADPTLDVNGGDAAHKLAILATLAFGVRVHPAHIATEGIDGVDASDIEYADGFDYAIRPVAVASRSAGNVLDLRVHPALVPYDNPLANISGALNAVSVRGEQVGTCLLSGPGAGAGPTAMSVVSDVIDVARNILKNASGRVPSFIHDGDAEPLVQDPNDLRASYYLRFTVRDEPGVLSKITGKLSDFGISIEKMFQNVQAGAEGAATVVIVSHKAREGDVHKALSELDPLPHTLAPARLLRILG
ncbi:MAG TPA: homoserine dehydrogenase [Polyangiales bacterium]|nr:homoserine dehydrogenase [Polyangiales bacterium]